jgi:hypothetical protein
MLLRFAMSSGPLYWAPKEHIVVKKDDDDDLIGDEVPVEPVFGQELTHFYSFFEEVRTDAEIQSLVEEIDKAIAVLDPLLQAHLQSWQKYYDIWELDKPSELDKFSETAKYLRDFEAKT